MGRKLNNGHAAIIDFLNDRHPGENVSVTPETDKGIEAAKHFLSDAGHGKYTGTIDQMSAYFEAIESVKTSAWKSGKV